MAATSLYALFLCYVPLSLLELIADASNKYGNEDSVKKTKARPGQQSYLTPCDSADPEARHRFQHKRRKWRTITVGSVLQFLAIMIAMGALGTRCVDQLSAVKDSYGADISWVRNSMPEDVFQQHRQYLHFVDNSELPRTGQPGWEPLQKIRPLITHFQATFAKNWRLGEKLAVDE